MKKKAPIPQEEIDRLVAKATARLSTPEGQEALRQVFEKSEQNQKLSQKAADPAESH